jgi:hypothetical protein
MRERERERERERDVEEKLPVVTQASVKEQAPVVIHTHARTGEC